MTRNEIKRIISLKNRDIRKVAIGAALTRKRIGNNVVLDDIDKKATQIDKNENDSYKVLIGGIVVSSVLSGVLIANNQTNNLLFLTSCVVCAASFVNLFKQIGKSDKEPNELLNSLNTFRAQNGLCPIDANNLKAHEKKIKRLARQNGIR